MGSVPSKRTNNDDWDESEKRALIIYNYRIKNYNPIEHGPPTQYMLRVNAEYELECIPEYLRLKNTPNKS